MKFHDIFAVRKKIKKEIQKPKIIIDYREKNSLVASYLSRENFEIQFQELKVGDYIVRNVVIERKTIADFINSMINKRLLKQIEELKQYKNKLLIIEGIDEQELYNDEKSGVNGNALRGFILSIILKHKIPILFTKNSEDTAKFISVLSKKQGKEISLKAKKRTSNKKEQMQFILEGFQGIGPKNSRKLLEEFGSIKKIINSSEEELKKIIGKKAEIFRLIEENY